MVLLDFFFHVGEIHAPNALLFAEGAEDDVPSRVAQVPDEARIRRAVDQDGVSRFSQNLDSASNAAVDAIFIADHVPCQFRPVMTGRLPFNDALVIGIRRQEVTKKRMFQPLFHGLDDSRASREIHVRYPHGDFIETGLGLIRFKAPNGLANAIESRSIFTSSVNNRRKIVFHINGSPFTLRTS